MAFNFSEAGELIEKPNAQAGGFHFNEDGTEIEAAPKEQDNPPKRGFTDVIKDVGVSFAGGANALLETGGTLAGLTGIADMDNWARTQGESGKKYWDEQKSAGLKADEAERRAAIDSADGQWSKAGTAFWETVKNPALLSSFAAEQIPMFLPIGMAGRAGQMASLATGAAGKTASVAGKVAGKVGTEGVAARIAQKGLSGISTAEKAAGAIGTTTGIGAGALLQGADVGGDTYNDVLKLPQSLWEHNADYQSLRMQVGDQPAKEAIAHDLAQQAATEGGVASVLTNLLPFARTFERATAGAPTKLKGNIVARGIKGFAGESLQEASEEGWGKVASNRAAQEIDVSRGLEEGVGEAAGMGAVGGGVMGGVMGMASNPAPPGSLTSAANIAAQQGIIPNEAIDAAELLGTPEAADTAPPLAEAAQAPLAEPASMSILDGVTNGATSRPISATLDTGSATSASDNAAGSDTNGVLQHDAATGAGGLGMPGTAVENDGAGGVQSNGSNQPRHVGHPSEVVLPDNSALPAQWEVVDADQVTATLKEGKNQPRDRSRAAADAQVQGIANMPDYRRLADSPVMDVGAPTISHDGAIVGGNGRFEGVSRAYDQGTAAEYRARLEADAVTKGIDPATFSGMKKPVLVRRITQPFDTRALAVASNSGGSLQYSALEQAKIDGERMNGLGDIEVNDTGDVVMSGDNMANVRRALTGYNAAELGSMTDKDGLLSQEGIRRIKNALLYKAYGNSSVLSRLVESADPDLKSVMGALVRSAGSVASVRADMKDGNKPISVDIADDLLSSVEQLAKIKAQGSSVEQHLSQQGMFGNQASAESAVILRYLSDNIRSQKRMAGFIKQYYDGLASEDHLTGSMFAAAPVTKKERLSHAITETERANPAAGQVSPISARQTAPRPDSEPVAQTGQQPANAQGDAERGGTGQQDTGVTGDGTKAAPITVENHDHIKQAEQRVNTNPTDAQKEAGNYQKAHVQWNGLDITIENPQGSIRSGKDANGKAWEVTMPATYGYIKRTEGADGDHIDVYLGKHLQNQTVYVIDQIDLKTGKFDEHKNMLGFATLREAERIYKLGFSDGKGKHRLGATTPMTLEKFKEWIKTEDTTKPVAESLLTSYTATEVARREAAQAAHKPMGSLFNQPAKPTAESNPDLQRIIKKAHEVGVSAARISEIGNDIPALTEEIGRAVMAMGSKPAAKPAAKQSDNALTAALNEYEETGEIGTVDELADRIESMIDEGTAPDSLTDAIKQYRDDQAYDRELSGRGDMDAAEVRLIAAIRAAANEATTTKEQQATAILDRANVTGKDRLDIMRDFKDGKHSLADLEKAYPTAKTNEAASSSTPEAESKASFPSDQDVAENIGREAAAPQPELQALQKELDAALVERDRIREKQMASFRNGTATRARTTTGNANADWANERVISLRKQIKDLQVAKPSQPAQAEQPASGEAIEDFGEKIGGARKDKAAAMREAVSRELADGDIASMPLSKIWPKDSIDQIEDTFIAAVAHAARAEVPAKPKVGYKLKAWVEKVKFMRGLVSMMLDGKVTKERFAEELKKYRNLEHFAEKVELLEQIDRASWDRIGRVEANPNAYRYEPSEFGASKQVATPIVRVEIDGRSNYIPVSTVADAVAGVQEKLGIEVAAKKMEFEVRGQPGRYAINKKGDPLYRKLKTFETSKEALDYRDTNYADLVAAWEAVKASDNVKEDDVRGKENRPRSSEDWRKGKDVTPEQFSSDLGFRAVEFGNWVGQGKSAKERQGMLNEAYDAFMDLASIIGVPPKAISLNGSLGLGFGSRGSGKASAHFEPDMLVINLTKTRGAGTLAHEWFHAMDNYFQRDRIAKGETSQRLEGGHSGDFITYAPENYYVNKRTGQRMPARDFALAQPGHVGDISGTEQERKVAKMRRMVGDPAQWELKEGVRPEVGEAFADLVKALNESPMAKRASLIDKGKSGGYWSRIIERGARSFENYVIHKMMLKGYHNDYLANVTPASEFARDAGRYPYLLENEVQPVADSFDNLFATIQTKETDRGVAIFNTQPGDAIPKSEWLSVGSIVEEVDQLLKPFVTEIPVLVRDTLSETGIRADDGNVAAGAVIGGRIHLFRDGLTDRAAVVRTLWHELLHFGFRRFMTEEQYIAKMGELYMKDGWVRNRANAWMQTAEAKKLAETKKHGYVRARAVDEALAELAEIMQTEPTGYQNNTKLAQAKRTISEWIAKLADFFGFKEAAQAWREYAAQKDARDLIVATFAKLREGAPPSMLNAKWHYSDPAFMVAWHGSPHDHNKFDMEYVGAGEGNQAYGHGLYFAGSKEVAEWYRAALSRGGLSGAAFSKDGVTLRGDEILPEYFKPGRIVNGYGGQDEVLEFRKDVPYQGAWSVKVSDVKDTARYGKHQPRWHSTTPKVAEVEKALAAEGWSVSKGRLYQVELAPAEEDYLLWDRPLSEQSEKVKATLSKGYQEQGMNYPDAAATPKTGRDIYDDFRAAAGGLESMDAQAASEYLHSLGIRGIKYLDGSSRDMSGTKWADGVNASKYDRLAKGVAENYLRDRGDVKSAIRSLREVPTKAGKQYSDAADALESGDLVQELNYNFVIFSDSDVSITAKFSKAAEPNATPQTIESVRQATVKLRASWHGFKQVRIVQSVKEIPSELYLRALRAAKPIAQDSEGIYDPKTRTVYLIADNLASPERAVWVAIHEVAGHGGIRMLGSPVVDALEFAGKNGYVKKLAQAIAADRGETFDAKTHTDEAIAELAAATITGKVDAIMERYGIKVPMGMRSNLLGMIKRVVDAVRNFISRVTGKPVEEVSDGEVLGLIRQMKDAVEGKDQGYDTAGVSNGVLASKAQSALAQAIAGWSNVVDSYLAGILKRDTHPILLPSTPASMQVMGLPDMPVRIKSLHSLDHIGTRLDAETMKQIPAHVANPALVYFYKGTDGKHSMNFVTGLKTGNRHIVIALHPNAWTPEAGKAHYMATVMDMEAHKINAIVRGGGTLYVGDLKAIPGMGEAFAVAKRENGREAVNLRELASQTFSLLATVGNSIKYKSAAVNVVDHGDALFSSAPKQQSIPGTTQPPAQPPRQGKMPLQGGQPGNRASWDSPEPSMFDDLVYKLQDKNIDLKRVLQAIRETGAQVAEQWNAYLQEELFHGRAAKHVQDFVNTELKPMMIEMAQRGMKQEELDAYLHARHAKEANALIASRDPNMPDGGSGMTNQEADDYFANLPNTKRKQLEATARRVDAILAKTREYYASYGLVSRDQVDGWAQMFKHYVPLMREDHDGGMGIGQGFSIKGKEVKHRIGSTAKVVDILANIAMQREKAIVRGEKNRVAVALAGLAKLNPNPDFWTFDKAPTKRVLNEKTGLVEERIDPTFRSRPNVVVAKIKDSNGNIHERAVIFNEHDERAVRMAESMKNLDATQLGGWLGVSAKVTRYFSAINTQYNPIFGVTNLVRDVQGMALNLSSTPLAGHRLDVIKRIPAALAGIYMDARATRKGHPATSKVAQDWEELQDSGGMTGYRDLYRNSGDRAKAIEHELDPHNWVNSKWGKVFTAGGALKVPLTTAQDMASPLFDWLSDYNLMMEGSTRLAIYQTAIDHGMTKQAAASLAKNTTVNFNRKGQSGQQAGAMYAFFNAAMQGTARISETVFNMEKGDIKTLRLSKTGKAIIGGGVLLGVMQALALAAAGFDDDEPPEFIRERNLIFPIGWAVGGKRYISIPMPLGFHAIPNVGRIATEYALGGFKKPADHVFRLMGVFAEAFNPMGSAGISVQTVAPTALDPFAALEANKDWTGKTIYKEDFNSMKPTPGFTRNKDTASAWSKFLAEGINYVTGGTDYTPGAFSPTADQIDYLIGQVTGGVGREVSKGFQTGEALVTGESLPTHKVPLVGRFYGNLDDQSSQGNRYYTNLKEINLIEMELKGRREDHLPTDGFRKENPKAQLIARAKHADNIISKLRKQKRELIEKNAERDKVRQVEERITAEMLRFNTAVDKFEARTP